MNRIFLLLALLGHTWGVDAPSGIDRLSVGHSVSVVCELRVFRSAVLQVNFSLPNTWNKVFLDNPLLLFGQPGNANLTVETGNRFANDHAAESERPGMYSEIRNGISFFPNIS